MVETIESLVLDWAVERLTSAGLKQLSQIIDRADKQTETLNWRGALLSIATFHQVLLDIAQKPQTAELLMRLFNQVCLLENIRERRAPRGLPGWNRRIKSYRALLNALESGEVAAAQKTLSAIRKADCAEVLPCFSSQFE